MRDIAATIQPGQDALIRAAPAVSLCVQGAPGTGKTAVGLHRAAYLLYGDGRRGGSLLVLGPDRGFLDHIAEVLPSSARPAYARPPSRRRSPGTPSPPRTAGAPPPSSTIPAWRRC
ncbi:hypothetical protein ACFQVA_32755 [Actinomadura keratinilytica]